MSPKCNASAPPPRISPDNDITGVGVLANYIGTAGVAILVILVYFLVVYEPARDPFNKVDAYFHPNPVDDTLLTWVRRFFRGFRDRRIDDRRRHRREQTFIKCLLATSDLQLVTGLSVMISGFVQFRSGISTYHFVMIVYLAYFSTVTHLSCLTALRQYLHDHKIERQWRLLGMTLLAILLIVGLAFTGNYDWAVSLNPGKRPGPGDYAACYIDVTSGALVGVLSTITSIFFVALALISRVIKLHGYLSRNVCGRARTWVSRSVWGPLRAMHSRLEIKKSPLHSLRRTLIYRPVLVLLLMPRVLLDLWCSVSFEVGWLITAFLWGVYRLLSVRPMPEQQGLLTDPDDDDSSDWTYGQVVSVVLLVAPFITMIGYFNDDDAPERKDAIAARASPSNLLLIPLESSSLSTEPIYSNESVYDPDHPERGWMYRKATLVDASVYSMLTLTWNAYFLLFASLHSSTPTPLYAFIIWGPVAVNFLKNFALGLTGLYGVIVFSLMIETTLARWDRVYRIVLHFLIIAYFILSFSSVFFSPAASSFLQPMAGVCYIVSALVYRLVGSSE